MRFTEEELERQRRANIEHALRHAIDALDYWIDNPFSSQDEWRGACEDLIEELKPHL